MNVLKLSMKQISILTLLFPFCANSFAGGDERYFQEKEEALVKIQADLEIVVNVLEKLTDDLFGNAENEPALVEMRAQLEKMTATREVAAKKKAELVVLQADLEKKTMACIRLDLQTMAAAERKIYDTWLQDHSDMSLSMMYDVCKSIPSDVDVIKHLHELAMNAVHIEKELSRKAKAEAGFAQMQAEVEELPAEERKILEKDPGKRKKQTSFLESVIDWLTSAISSCDYLLDLGVHGAIGNSSW
jgi:hypothetical protein